MTTKDKAKKLAPYLFPYKGQSLNDFWDSLEGGQRFWVFHVLSQVVKL